MRRSPEAVAGLLALVLALLHQALIPLSGTDLAAQLARADFARSHPFTPVDFSWYEGVHPFGYSVLSPWLMALLGVGPCNVLAAVLGAVLLTRLLRDQLRPVPVAVLAWFGLRTLWSAFRVRLGGESADEVASPRRAFLTSLAATASNPTTILSWAAVFAAVSTAGGTSTALLVAGVGCGTLTWFTILSLALTVGRPRVGPRLLPAIDAGAGLGLLGFAGVLGVRSVRDAG